MLMKETKPELQKTVEIIKQHTYEKNPKKTQYLHYFHKFNFCNAPNWNPTHKCSALGKPMQ